MGLPNFSYETREALSALTDSMNLVTMPLTPEELAKLTPEKVARAEVLLAQLSKAWKEMTETLTELGLTSPKAK